MNKIVSSLILLNCLQGLSYAALADQGVIDCDPVVHVGAQATTLQKALTGLAEQYDFDLIFPVDADRPVESVDSMTLSQSLKYLTSDVNTVLQHEKVEGCAKARLVALEVLPVGEDTEYVYVKPVAEVRQSRPRKEKKKKSREKLDEEPDIKFQAEAASSDDMGLYAEEVLLGQRKRDLNMTPEQLVEFRKAKRQARKRLEAAGLLESGRSKNKNKNRSQGKRKEKWRNQDLEE